MKVLQLYRKSPNAFFYLLGLAVFGLFVVLTVWGDDGLVHLLTLKSQKNGIVTRNNRILMENLQLMGEIQGLQKPLYIEQSARTELGMVRGSETVYVVEEEAAQK